MLIGLPLLGIVLASYPVKRYLEFPPESRYISHAPFSWIAFIFYSLFIIAVTMPFIKRGISSLKRHNKGRSTKGAFPWWGWNVLWSESSYPETFPTFFCPILPYIDFFN
jgi:hypothetical protein